jgi:sodium/pantothenate symporter
MRVSLIAPLLLIVYGCTMPWLLLHFYVTPYQIGAGVIAAGESVSWQYAEPWFVLGPCLIHVPLGLLTWHVIRKRYSPLSVLNISKTSTPQP